MNERKITELCMAATRLVVPGAEITKHADRYTAGIPDVSVAALGNTYWIEMKHLRKGEQLKDIVETIQLVKCHALATATNGRCWIMVYEDHPKQLTVWFPRALFAHLYPKMAGPDAEGGNWQVIGRQPYESDSIESIVNPLNVMRTFGAIRVPGWPADAMGKLVKAA